MNLLSKRIRLQREKGAVALVVALCMVMLLAAGALGVDIAKLAYERQALRAAVDAGAQAGGYALNNRTGAQAKLDAVAFTKSSAPDLLLTSAQVQAATYCTVALKVGTLSTPEPGQVAYQCPGSGWVEGSAVTGCNSTMCTVPCLETGHCNTIKVTAQKTVDFMFGPAIYIPTGSTGALSSASCRGDCGGSPAPNPMDVVVMADRTASMTSGDIDAVKSGVKAMLAKMNREQQFVAFGAIHKSVTRASCLTSVPKKGEKAFEYTYTYYSNGSIKTTTKGNLAGTWVPVPFSYDYTTGDINKGTAVTNESSLLADQIDCMAKYGRNDTTAAPGYLYAADEYPSDANGLGTHLASALKGAARYLYGSTLGGSNNLGGAGFPDRSTLGVPVKKVIILETDGRPEELFTSGSSALDLTNGKDIGSTDGEDACDNLGTVAEKVKDLENSLIITIAYGSASTQTCKGGWTPVRNVLAAAASPKLGTNIASVADQDCTTENGRKTENADNDFYFCAATDDELKYIFTAAIGNANEKTKFIKVPGVGD